MGFEVTPCEYLFLSSVGSEKNRHLKTQRFDQYALIVFRRMLDSVADAAKVCFETLHGGVTI